MKKSPTIGGIDISDRKIYVSLKRNIATEILTRNCRVTKLLITLKIEEGAECRFCQIEKKKSFIKMKAFKKLQRS